jgi:hypothetical protein
MDGHMRIAFKRMHREREKVPVLYVPHYITNGLHMHVGQPKGGWRLWGLGEFCAAGREFCGLKCLYGVFYNIADLA